jgi:apolipoprotein D and lipocalin family protein
MTIRSVESMDLNKYLGLWYEIARLPNFFEKADMCNIVAEYTLLPSGLVGVRNSSVRADGSKSEVRGVARVVDQSNSKLKVTFASEAWRFLPFVWGNYWILDLDDEYKWAIVGEPGRKFLWILSRSPKLPETDFGNLCARAGQMGYAVTSLIKPQQEVASSEQDNCFAQ